MSHAVLSTPLRRLAATAMALGLAAAIAAVPAPAEAATQKMKFVGGTHASALARCNAERQVWLHDGWRVSACTILGYGPGLVYYQFTATN